MKIFQLATLAFAACGMAAFTTKGRDTEFARPKGHFTPQKGWMNDPNGLFYDKRTELYHLYFQFNPNDTIWGTPLYWGHATSKDLTHWTEHEVAIGPDHDDEGIFSGCIVIDENNTSGLFGDDVNPHQRVVAFYTLFDEKKIQKQEMAYSIDGGYTFTKYKENPVVDVGSMDFRDPKVFWHEPTKTWIMSTVMAKDYQVVFYGSKNLKKWEKLSAFSGGLYGNQYECSGLMQVPIEGTSKVKDVLILSINPGAPIGGSIDQYFVGEFNGTHFTPDDHQTRYMDIGKDFYAAQEFSSTPAEDGVLAIGWASNWQYANRVPTFPWRASMSLVRNYTLREVNTNIHNKQLTLCLLPVMRNVKAVNEASFTKTSVNSSAPLLANFEKLNKDSTGFFDFKFVFNILDTTLLSRNDTTFSLIISSQESKSGVRDTLTVGFDSSISTFFLDRGNVSNPFVDEPTFTNKQSVYVEPVDGMYELYGVVDRDIMELYFNNGSTAMTNVFFFGEGLYPHDMRVETKADKDFIKFESIKLRELLV